MCARACNSPLFFILVQSDLHVYNILQISFSISLQSMAMSSMRSLSLQTFLRKPWMPLSSPLLIQHAVPNTYSLILTLFNAWWGEKFFNLLMWCYPVHCVALVLYDPQYTKTWSKDFTDINYFLQPLDIFSFCKPVKLRRSRLISHQLYSRKEKGVQKNYSRFFSLC